LLCISFSNCHEANSLISKPKGKEILISIHGECCFPKLDVVVVFLRAILPAEVFLIHPEVGFLVCSGCSEMKLTDELALNHVYHPAKIPTRIPKLVERIRING
jgi:hypothetical protein